MKIYYNPRCNTCRQALDLIKQEGIEPEVIEYLKEPPSKKELQEIVDKLGISPRDLIRKSETLYKENFSKEDHTDEEWLQIMADNPKLIQRPIVVVGNQAVLGRPPENVLQLLK